MGGGSSSGRPSYGTGTAPAGGLSTGALLVISVVTLAIGLLIAFKYPGNR